MKQDIREKEALARKGRGRKPEEVSPEKHPQTQPSTSPPHRVVHDPRSSGRPVYDAPEPMGRAYGERSDRDRVSSLSKEYEHIHSPVRDIIQQQRQAQLEMMMQSQHQQQQQQYREQTGASGGLSLYQAPSADAVDSFVRGFKSDHPRYGEGGGEPSAGQYPPPHYASQSYGPPPGQGPGGYPRQPPYDPSPYASYNQHPGPPMYNSDPAYPYPPQYPHQYPPHHPQQHQQQQQRAQQYPSLQLQPGNFYPPDQNDISLVSDSRLIPTNPWSSSDILSSLVPIGARASAAANAAAESQHRQYGGFNSSNDLEKSMASESTLVYLGRRTPAGTEVRTFILFI